MDRQRATTPTQPPLPPTGAWTDPRGGASSAVPEAEPCRVPANEQARLEALHSYAVLDTGPEPSFDDITQLAAQLCNAPVSLISLVDERRIWFKSRTGVEVPEAPRDTAFCGRSVMRPE